MNRRAPRFALLAAILTAFLCSACGSPEKGVCIRGSGIFASCGDDFTSASCGLINGDTFIASTTCEEQGFRGASAFDTPSTAPERVEAALQQAARRSGPGEPLALPDRYRPEASTFLAVPDAPRGNGQMIENRFSAIPVGSRVMVLAGDDYLEFDVVEEPTLRLTPLRVLPGAGVVTRDYELFWRGEDVLLDDLWVFYNEEGSAGRLVEVSWPERPVD